jgi:hypothetical protein
VSLKNTLLLSNEGLANVREKSGVGGAALSVVGPGFAEAEGAIDGEADVAGPAARVRLSMMWEPFQTKLCKALHMFSLMSG